MMPEQDTPASLRLEDLVDPAKHRVRLVNGYATSAPGAVTVGGVSVPAFWLTHIDAQEYDPVWVLMLDRPDAPSLAVVIGVNGPPDQLVVKPITGTVTAAPIGSDTITVSTASGNVDAAFPASYTPQVSDKVRLLWQDDNAWVLGKSAKVPAPPAPKPPKQKPDVPPPPTGSGKGQDTFTAAESATWSTGTGSWNSYMGRDLYQGSYGSTGANRGAWFYHNKPSKLKGRSPVKVEIWVPKRLRAGSYNSSVTLNLFLHFSAKRGGSDVSRGSSFDVAIPKGFKGGWKELPVSWGAQLIAGRGIGMAGGSYAGFAGISGKNGDARSGQVRITWEG
ncbi:hypothetical protein [Arthrobacter sp.]|uniref:hypothetical protein n=1 Tax=Arthrobacter sp. TaxID=1667 RepID=UPI003A9387B1